MKYSTNFSKMTLAVLVLLCSFMSCTEEDEPEEAPEGTGTYQMTCTGAFTFDVSATMEAGLVVYPDKHEAVLALDFKAPEDQWRRLVFNIWNDGEDVADKLYLVYPYAPGEYVDIGEAVSASLLPDESTQGWVYPDRGQIEFEYYAPGKVKGWFHFIMVSNVPAEPEIEDITISGTFDTPYTSITR